MTACGSGEELRGPRKKVRGPAHPVELPEEVWAVIMDKLTLAELAKMAPVAKAWRDAGVERAAKRRAAAVARVTAPEHVPDHQLSTPQRILRAMSRHLLGRDALTWGPGHKPHQRLDSEYKLPHTEPGGHPQKLRVVRWSWPCGTAWGLYLLDDSGEFCEHESLSLYCFAQVSPGGRYSASTPMHANLSLRPRSLDECEWMQGLLLALSEGCLGEPCPAGDRGDRLVVPPLRGCLARCKRLNLTWSECLHDSHQPRARPDLVLLPIFHRVLWRKPVFAEPVYGQMTWALRHDGQTEWSAQTPCKGIRI